MIKSIVALLGLSLLALPACILADDYEVYAKIISCPGCKLNRHHELRDFLKVEVPEGYPASQIELNWVGGKRAMMTLYSCAERTEECLVEDVSLFEYETKKDMHEMMALKGFKLRAGQEWMLRAEAAAEEEEEEEEEHEEEEEEEEHGSEDHEEHDSDDEHEDDHSGDDEEDEEHEDEEPEL